MKAKQDQVNHTPGFWDDIDYPTPSYDPTIPVHDTRPGAQATASEVPAVLEEKFDLERTVTYPHPPGTYLSIEMVQNQRIQIEHSTGFLPDFRYYRPGNMPCDPEGTQWPVDYLPTTPPLEMPIYRNSQISEDDYFALAQARVAAALKAGGIQ